VGFIILSLSLSGGALAASGDESDQLSSEQALKRLMDGNVRFVEGKSQHPHESSDWRSRLTKGQHPFVGILGCADSRVPIELIFDVGFGDAFVIRVAGNALDANVVGSIEYAVAHTNTPLLLVLGHEGCGGVSAALASAQEQEKEMIGIQWMLQSIMPALRNIDESLSWEQQVHAGVEANARYQAHQLLSIPEIRDTVNAGKLKIVAAVYDLETGKVRMLD
jgi:carbonic anhydrase